MPMFPSISAISLLFPLGLIALLAIPLILWLHLRRERSRTVVVPSLLLWQQVPRPSSMKERRWLPLSLLLLLQLLIAALFALVLSQPQGIFLFGPKQQHTVVIIDVSTSMAARDGERTRLDVARNRATRILNTLGEQSLLTLITAGPESRLVATGYLVQQNADFRMALDTLMIQGHGTDIRNALLLAQTALESRKQEFPRNQQRVVVLSDLTPPPDLATLPYPVEWDRIGEYTGNQAIVAFDARMRENRQNPEQDLYLRVANYSEATLTSHLWLTADGKLIDTRLVTMRPGGAVDLAITIPSSVAVVEATLEERDHFPLDNVARLNLKQTRLTKTLLVSEHPELLVQILKTLDGIQVFTIDPATYVGSPLAEEADLTIFDSVLPALSNWPTGSVLVIAPPSGSTLLPVAATTALVGTERIQSSPRTPSWLGNLNLEGTQFGPIAQIAELPWVETMLAAADPTPGAPVIPLIMSGTLAEQQIVVWTFGLQTSNLHTRLAFPLLVAQTIRDLTPPPFPAALALGDPLVLYPARHADTVMIYPPGTTPITTDTPLLVHPVAADHRMIALNAPLQPGLYPIVERRGETNLATSWLAVNAGSPIESDLRERAAPSVGSIAPPPNMMGEEHTMDASQRDKQPLWSWVAIAGLAFLMIEWLFVSFQRS